MKTLIERMLVVCFVLVLPVSAVYAGGKSQGTQSGASPSGLTDVTFVRSSDDTMEINIFSKIPETFEDNRWSKLYADNLNYAVKYLWISKGSEQYTQKFNAAIATGELPDIVQVNKIQLKQLVDADLIIDIKPYFDRYASDLLKSMIAQAGDRAVQAATINGVQYGVPLVDCDLETAAMLWIRQDWLEKTGKTAPATLDELESMILEFNRIAGSGAIGLNVQKDIWNDIFGLGGMFQAYGAYPLFWVKTGAQLGYGSVQPEMKEALARAAQWYKKGIIDREFLVKDGTKASEGSVSGKNGVFYGTHANSLWPLQDNINNEANADWLPYPVPALQKGGSVKPGLRMLTSNWYAVSRNCKHPEALIKMLNLYVDKVFDEKNQEYAYYANPGNGLEGVWRLSPVFMNSANKNQVTATNIVKPLEDHNPGNLWGEQLSMYEYSQKAVDGDRGLWGWNRVFGANGSQQLLMKYQKAGNFVYDEFFGPPTPTMAERKTTLDAMLSEAFIKIITGEADISSFDTTVAQWESSGGAAMTKEINAWYALSK
ncbi:MAG: extracellular solute-binding protein [Spirochaetaceae bacterium]|jgi:putative aldouronate transport system substrate-binding protein|nr:extracellular solute-binding protein [Spirochaetaceae bacterium]